MARPDVMIYVSTLQTVGALVRRGRIVDALVRPRDSSHDLSQAIDATLALLHVQPSQVWVLSSDLWSQTVTVDADVARRVPRLQLAQFMSFESEPYSGIRAGEAKTGVCQIGETESGHVYWVTQTEAAQFRRVAETVAQYGGRLAGLLHPAGVPGSLDATLGRGTPWRRLELWPDLAVVVYRDAKGSLARRFLPREAELDADLDPRRWTGEHEVLGNVELLLANGDDRAPLGLAPARRFSLHQRDDLLLLLGAWAQVLSGRAQAPILLHGPQPMPLRTRRLATAGIAAVLLLACIGHWRGLAAYYALRADSLRTQVAELTAPTEAATALRKTVSELEQQSADIRGKRDTLDRQLAEYGKRVDQHRQRLPHLLRTLSTACSETLYIKSITHDRNALRIQGRCLYPFDANSLAATLAREMDPLGMTLELPFKEGQLQLTNAGPHDFELVIRDLAPEQSP